MQGDCRLEEQLGLGVTTTISQEEPGIEPPTFRLIDNQLNPLRSTLAKGNRAAGLQSSRETGWPRRGPSLMRLATPDTVWSFVMNRPALLLPCPRLHEQRKGHRSDGENEQRATETRENCGTRKEKENQRKRDK
ncbi:hypothetical protein DPEC_G00340050 [Dallia pectoralis]|uniref:Uncharacterized protein n=1 Tax=Dallia pectoralis TaxID=75939 RepID=A0ACC2F4Y6_DALPE|nr:hypothetical protein DPEC_G00340050 [Dallia pectoralis]